MPHDDARRTNEKQSEISEQMPLRLLYLDEHEREWLVRDGIVQNMTFVPLQLGDQYARFRIFDLRSPRARKVYVFHKDESHGASGTAIEFQFSQATMIEWDEPESLERRSLPRELGDV